MTKGKNDIDLNMEEIDRKIDEMPVLDLRDPKGRKKISVNLDDIVGSFDLEAAMREAGQLTNSEPGSQARSEYENPENSETGSSDPDAETHQN